MPSSPAHLIDELRIKITDSVPWGTKPSRPVPGIYIVSIHEDAERTDGIAEPPLDVEVVAAWINRAAGMLLRGRSPSANELKAVLARYWLGDEAILYIGLTRAGSGLRGRVGAYYRHVLGKPRPHRGGHWVKVIANLQKLTVHYAELSTENDLVNLEKRLLRTFSRNVSAKSRAAYPSDDREFVLPFGNLEIKGKYRRNHQLTNQADN